MSRARCTRRHGIEGSTHDGGNVFRYFSDARILGEGFEERLLVALGQDVFVAPSHGNIRGDRQHRNGGSISFGNTWNHIGRASATRPLHHAHPVSQSRVDVGHVGGGSLISAKICVIPSPNFHRLS